MLRFDRFTLDPENLRLEDESGPIRLNHKAFDVLRVLIERRGRLVSKEQLLDAVWPDTHVSDGVLKVCMTEIRSALGDSASAPRFVETVHRRGYRFIAEVSVAVTTGVAQTEPASAAGAAARRDGAPEARVLVGRVREVEELAQRLGRALGGERQLVFVTGEPGAGKTALVDHFVATAARDATLAVTSGQSLEHFGSREAYMPVLEAVGRLVRDTAFARSLLRRYAPTWFAQFPWLVESDDREKLARELLSATRERMLREMGEFLEALTAEVPLVLVLEDLHWCDPSTVDLLSLLAARRGPARLLVLATCRPVDLILERHPLRPVMHALIAGRRASEVALDHLDVDAVVQYLQRRFGESRFSTSFARRLHDRTDGNPLFLVTVIDDLLTRGAIVEREGAWQLADEREEVLTGVPDTLRLLIEQRLARLNDDDRRVLEAGSLMGLSFSTNAAAAGAGCSVDEAEERCERLAAAGSFLCDAGKAEWPNGKVASRYAFSHTLYRDTLVEAAPARRKAEAHLRIGRAFEEAWGGRVGDEWAATLALHFEAGADRERALHYRRIAADIARSRHALIEAESHLDSALGLLADLPPSPRRDGEELVLQSKLGAVRMATRGYAAPEVVAAYSRALELSSGIAEDPRALPILWGLWSFYVVRAELARALELAQRMHAIAEAYADRLMRLVGHLALATTYFFYGNLAAALDHTDTGEDPDELPENADAALAYGQDQKVVAIAQCAVLYCHLGRVDQAIDIGRHAIDRGRALGHPMSIALPLAYANWVRIVRREPQACRIQADEVIRFAAEQGLPHWIPGAMHSRGWALAEEGDLTSGIASMEEGLLRMAAIGASLGRGPRLVDLAEAKVRAGQLAQAHAVIDEVKALIAATGERYHESEMLRVEAELVLAEGAAANAPAAQTRARAEQLIEDAIACARGQGSRTLELRATNALARLCRRGAKAQQASARLAECLAEFTEGAETADVREAQRLLER